jgi:hypothetical protein
VSEFDAQLWGAGMLLIRVAKAALALGSDYGRSRGAGFCHHR